MKGIIRKAIGGFFFVTTKNKLSYRTKIRGKIRKRVYPGDYVEISVADKIIESVYPRENLLQRPRIANVDQVLVVQSVTRPDWDGLLLDRFLLMIEAAQLNPIIVINKLDLVENQNSINSKLKVYTDAGYRVFFVSAKERVGLDKLKEGMTGMVNVLTGPSGVGKSALINSLVPAADLQTQEVSAKLDRGVHTTRYVELLPLGEGGLIADTPGFTSLSIDNISKEELTYLMPEFRSYLRDCKFSRCSHTHEPDCAVKEAVNKGEISEARYQSYKMFYKELSND